MEWEVEELQKLSKIQPDMVNNALEDLWQRNPALFKSVVINAYLDKKINLGKASELLGVTRWELEKELKTRGIPIRSLSKDDVAAEVGAIKEW